MTSPVKNLYDVCTRIARAAEDQTRLQEEIETGAVSGPLRQSITQALERLTLLDLGVTPAFFESGLITYVTIYNSPQFWMGFFCMAAGSRFPLHDHPRMIGCSRLLSGRILYRGLDIQSQTGPSSFGAAISAEYELVGCGTEMLTGNMRNVHEITAVEESVLLDLFVPYYDQTRECKYYREVARQDDMAVLEVDRQPNIPCREKAYRGAPIR